MYMCVYIYIYIYIYIIFRVYSQFQKTSSITNTLYTNNFVIPLNLRTANILKEPSTLIGKAVHKTTIFSIPTEEKFFYNLEFTSSSFDSVYLILSNRRQAFK